MALKYNIRPRPQDEEDEDGKLPQAKQPRALTLVQPRADGTGLATQTINTSTPNQFAAPSAQAATQVKGASIADEVRAPSALTYNVRQRAPQPAIPEIVPTVPEGARNVTPGAETSPAVDTRPAYQRRVEEDQAQIDRLRSTPLKKPGRFKAFMQMFGQGLGEAFGERPARDWGEFAAGLSRAGAEGVAGAIKPRIPAERKRFYQVKQLEAQRDSDMKTAQQESLLDNRTEMQRYRDARLKQMGVNQERLKDEGTRRRIANDLKRLPYIDPNNPTHARLLAEAREAGIEVDPATFGQGKTQPRMKVLDKDGVTYHYYERTPQGDWKRVRSEVDGELSAGMTTKRDPLSGETITTERAREFGREKFDRQKEQEDFKNRLAVRHEQAYETAVAMGGTREQIQLAMDRAESGMADDYESSAQEYQGKLDSDAKLDSNSPQKMEDWERTEMEKHVRDLREKAIGARRKGAATAGIGVPGAIGGQMPQPPVSQPAPVKDSKQMSAAEFDTYIRTVKHKDGRPLTDAEVAAAIRAHQKQIGQ